MRSWLAVATLLSPLVGCTVIVNQKLDEKDQNGDGDTDADTDTDTDSDGDCSLVEGRAMGVEGRMIEIPGGIAHSPILTETAPPIADSGAPLALIANWFGTPRHGFETQLFGPMWEEATRHNRVADLGPNPQTNGGIASTGEAVYAIFPSPERDFAELVRVVMQRDGDRLLETLRDPVLSRPSIREPSVVAAEDQLFYLWRQEAPDTSAYLAAAPPDGVAGEPLRLNPGGGAYADPAAGYSTTQERLVFAMQRPGAISSDVLYGIVDRTPMLLKQATVVSPPGQISSRPAVAVAHDAALVAFSTAESADADTDLLYQIVDVTTGELLMAFIETFSDEPTHSLNVAVTFHRVLGEFGLAWIEDSTPDEEGGATVWAGRMTREGNPIQRGPVSGETGGPSPRVAIAPVEFGYAVVWDGPEGRLGSGWYGCPPEGE